MREAVKIFCKATDQPHLGTDSRYANHWFEKPIPTGPVRMGM